MSIKTISALSALTMALTCGTVFAGIVQEEPLGDVARRLRVEREQEARQKKSIEVYQGRLTIKAIPKFADVQKQLINRMEIQIGNSSPLGYRYAFSAKCGDWSKAASGNIEGSSAPPKQKTISFDLPLPCKWSDASLEQVREAEGLEGPEPQPSKVPGIDDAELMRQAKIEKVVEYRDAPGNSISELQKRVDEACKQRPLGEVAAAPVSTIGEHMTACVKATDDLTAALRLQGDSRQGQVEAQNNANTSTPNSIPSNTGSSQGASLAALACRGYYEPRSGFNHVEGEVENLSSVPLNKVYAMVTWYTANGEFAKSEQAPIWMDPILPKQKAPFEVLTLGNPAMTRFRLAFKTFEGGTLMMEDRCSSQ